MNTTSSDLLRAPGRSLSAGSISSAGLPSRSEIEDWSTVIDQLSAAADAFGSAAEAIEITADAHVQQLLRPGGTDWHGDAANTAQEQGYQDRGVVYAAADLMRRMRKVAAVGAGNVQHSRDLAVDAISEAERDDFRVGEDLTVTDSRLYTAQETALYEARREMAEAHHGYIAMRARNLVTEDSRIGADLSAGAADLGAMIPSEWVDEQRSTREGSNGDGDIQAYDNDSDAEDPLSAEQIAERLRELRRGLNGGIREVDTEDEIFDLYEDLAKGGSPLPVPDNYYDRRVLPDGTIIGVRESNDHGPTLDVRYPPGVTGPDKVHLPPAPIAPPPTPPNSRRSTGHRVTAESADRRSPTGAWLNTALGTIPRRCSTGPAAIGWVPTWSRYCTTCTSPGAAAGRVRPRLVTESVPPVRHTRRPSWNRRHFVRRSPGVPWLAGHAEGVLLMVIPSPPANSVNLSTAEELRRHVADLRVIPPEGLSQWLPGLAVPVGWNAARVTLSSFAPARILVHGTADDTGGWLGCDVINLFYFSGTTTADVIKLGTDGTLRGLGVDAPITYRVTMPAELGVVATRSRGIAPLGARLWVQVTNYLVTTAAGSGLIEHTLLVRARSREQLKSDVQQLSESVRTALLAGIRAGTSGPEPQ